MFGKFQSYPEYKPTGLEWLESIPVDWATKPIKAVCKVDNSGHYGDEAGVYEKDLPVATTAQIDKSGNFQVENMPVRSFLLGEVERYLCRKGDILVVKSSGSAENIISGKAGYIDESTPVFIFSNFLLRLSPNKNKVNSKFLYYFVTSHLTTERIKKMVATTTYPNLQVGSYISSHISCPAIKEQEHIVNFLDHETARIDTLIEKQQQLIKLLKEKRQAVISHAVTKGLNPNAHLHNSGIEWLGEVPEHWKVVSLKHLVSAAIIDGPHLTPTKLDEGVPFISAEAISQGYINFDKKWGYISRADHKIYSKRYCPQKGDILMVKLGATTGVVAMVETEDEFNVWVPLATIRTRDYISSKFVFYLLQSSSVRDAIQLSWTYGTQQTLGLGTLSNLSLPVPPQEEGEKIVELIEAKIPLYDESVKKCEVSLQLLVERRTALISAAVTGKIDVRGWVAPAHPCASDMSASMHVTSPKSSRNKTNTKETVA